MHVPRVSFLSTAYRTEDRVSGMIDSVRAQTDPDWELVVVDNGMSDEMAAIVTRYSDVDPRVRLLRQENRGVAGGLNTAGAAARGRYVSVLNSDDHVEPEFCARLGDLLDSRPDLGVACCDAWFFSARTGERLPLSYMENGGSPRPDPAHVVTLAELIEGLCPYYTALVRRELWESYGEFDDTTAAVGDLQFFLRIAAGGHAIVVLPDKLASYSQAVESISRGGRSVITLEEQREAVVTHFAHESGRPEDLAALEREIRRSRHRRGVVGARVALSDGDVAGARRASREALRQKIDLRTLAIAAAVAVAPGTTIRMHQRRIAPRPVAAR
ncbi:glycosyltransferase family 2 protein [Pseudonocardia endophytica]|uniref:Glycosyl transferase family 2 n=1 Tax=Pseudonocardia endophytica TaxID=401976 RepID=A0A4R1HGP0_PSEEN|nr:glycosyltransferase family A protein [Pseudonocardia endophytica]TCK20878.1 glycosyl transferase family 2 [Pseudonocardia endophytica]